MNITVKYSCYVCRLAMVDVEVPARAEDEDLMHWMDVLCHKLSRDHHERSPRCRNIVLNDVMIPMAGNERVGGPAVH